MDAGALVAPNLPVYPPASRMERALDLLFPPLCVGCRRIGRWICADCWRKVLWLTPSDAENTAGLPPTLDAVVAVAVFEDVAREAVHTLKFQGRHAISGMMGKLMAEALRGHELDLVVPVPLHPSRRRERGYDQASLLARQIARALECPYRGDLLQRVRRTRQQTTLNGIERQANVRGAFRAKGALEGGSILLVDDVYTTGATLGAAAEAAREAGAARVLGAVFGRA